MSGVTQSSEQRLRAIEAGRELQVRQCRADEQYWMRLFWTIATKAENRDGSFLLKPFTLRSYQTEFLEYQRTHKRLIVLKGRQIGFTETIAAKLAWYAMVNPSSEIFYVSYRVEDAEKVMKQIRNIGYPNMPGWMTGKGRFP